MGSYFRRQVSVRAISGVVLVLLSAAVRMWVFQVHAVGLDQNEYCWTAKQGLLPHGPYLLYGVTGWLLSRLLDAEWGLSLLSLLSNLTAAGLLYRLLARQQVKPPARRVALATYLLFPVSIYQAGTQEVYAFQSAWVMAALLSLSHESPWAPWVSGGLFGLACLSHDGSLFLAPGFLAMMWYPSAGVGAPSGPKTGGTIHHADSTRENSPAPGLRWLAWVCAATLTLAAGIGILWARYRFLFPGDAWQLLVAQLRGISPVPGQARPETDTLVSLARVGANLSSLNALGWPVAALVGIPVFSLITTQHRRRWLAWMALALPYLVYEVLVSGSPDPGNYLVYVAPTAAVLLAEAFDGGWRMTAYLAEPHRWRGRWAGRLRFPMVAVTIALILIPGLTPFLVADGPHRPSPSGRNTEDLLAWIARSTPEDTLITGAGDEAEALSRSCRSGREVLQPGPMADPSSPARPETGYWRLKNASLGSGIIGPFLERVTLESLVVLLEQGRLILSLSDPPFDSTVDAALSAGIGTRYRVARYLPLSGGTPPPGPLYQLLLPRADSRSSDGAPQSE